MAAVAMVGANVVAPAPQALAANLPAGRKAVGHPVAMAAAAAMAVAAVTAVVEMVAMAATAVVDAVLHPHGPAPVASRWAQQPTMHPAHRRVNLTRCAPVWT